MYTSLRCVGRPSCRTTVRSTYYLQPAAHRAFHPSLSCKQTGPASDPNKKDENGGSNAPYNDGKPEARSRLTRLGRRRAADLRHAHSEPFMVVDPDTASVKIIEANNSNPRGRGRSRQIPPFVVPAWFIEGNIRLPNEAGFPLRALFELERDDTKPHAETSSRFRIVYSKSYDEDSKWYGESQETRVFIDTTLEEEIEAVARTGLDLVQVGRPETLFSARSAISLHCPLEGSVAILNAIVDHVASNQEAIVMNLKPGDFARLGGAYVCPDVGLDPSLRTLGFEAYTETEDTVDEDEEMPDEEDEDEGIAPANGKMAPPGVFIMSQPLPSNLSDAFKKFIGAPSPSDSGKPSDSKRNKLGSKSDDDTSAGQLMDQERLTGFLNALIDAAWTKRGQQIGNTVPNRDIAHIQIAHPPKLIIAVEDFLKITNTPIGREVTNKLTEVVRRRRAERGERIILVGLSSDEEALESNETEKTIQWEMDDTIWRIITVVPHSENGNEGVTSDERAIQLAKELNNLNINLDNWRAIWTEMVPPTKSSEQSVQNLLSTVRKALVKSEIADLFKRSILTQDEMHRLLTAALGHSLADQRETVNIEDLYIAGKLFRKNDSRRQKVLQSLRVSEEIKRGRRMRGTGLFPFGALAPLLGGGGLPPLPGQSLNEAGGAGPGDVAARLQALQQDGDRYEKRLINGVVLPERIKTTFNDVHVAKATTEAVRDLTGLALQRPDAFKYGVLATNTLSGLLLYGPPGTGKTMLAKAVAKESGAAVLTITGSDVNQMWVGESEKTVKAIFSLARKLSPCVVFIDEADALLASRAAGSGGRGRPGHRDTINQFLLEWDGMNETGVFLMVATNRPFDLDDAVLRRLPRRVLIDLPTKEDREAILRIHLKGEALANDVDTSLLAEQTPYYSGSDLKNVVVSAALTAVKEELEAKAAADAAATRAAEADTEADDSPAVKTYRYPEKRTLTREHFEKALGEIGASVSGDMSSLRQIKKFDEQFGDRKGRRTKSTLGFGEVVEREGDARVRA